MEWLGCQTWRNWRHLSTSARTPFTKCNTRDHSTQNRPILHYHQGHYLKNIFPNWRQFIKFLNNVYFSDPFSMYFRVQGSISSRSKTKECEWFERRLISFQFENQIFLASCIDKVWVDRKEMGTSNIIFMLRYTGVKVSINCLWSNSNRGRKNISNEKNSL